MSIIPPRQAHVEDKERRFYVVAPSSVYLRLQQESIQRGTDLWTLGGTVLTSWLNAGCPDFPVSSESPCPEPESGAVLLLGKRSAQAPGIVTRKGGDINSVNGSVSAANRARKGAQQEIQLALDFEPLCDATGLPVSVPASYRSMRLMLTHPRFIEFRHHPDSGLRDAWNSLFADHLHDLGGMAGTW